MVDVNGEMLDLAGKTVGDRLREEGRSFERIAVMINGEILPKSDYDTAVLRDGDKVDIVGFVGGG